MIKTQPHLLLMKSAALSATITIAEFVFDEGTTGIADASATLKFLIPTT